VRSHFALRIFASEFNLISMLNATRQKKRPEERFL